MKHVIHRLLCNVLPAVFLVPVLCLPVNAMERMESSLISEKERFAMERDAEFARTSSVSASILSDETTMTHIITELQIRYGMAKTNEERKEILEELERYGSYLYETSFTEADVMPMGDTSDVALSNITLFYNSSNSTWSMRMSGYWLDRAWQYDGDVGNMGGMDAFGVSFNGTSGTAPAMTGCYAYMTDERYVEIKETNLRSDGNTANGVGFRLQDRVYSYTGASGTYEYDYIGAQFGAVIYFDSLFKEYNGVATPYYVHTWAATTITELTLGAGTEGIGFEVTLSDSRYGFSAYGNDLRF